MKRPNLASRNHCIFSSWDLGGDVLGCAERCECYREPSLSIKTGRIDVSWAISSANFYFLTIVPEIQLARALPEVVGYGREGFQEAFA